MAKDQKSIIKWVNELVDLMEKRALGELEIDSNGERIKLSRNTQATQAGQAVQSTQAAQAVQAAHTAMPAATPVAEAASGENDFAAHPGALKSPIVGTAYLSSQPGAAQFADIGDKVSEGQTILIVEAMKVMNPILAHRAGTLTHLFIGNEEPVEYGQILAVIE